MGQEPPQFPIIRGRSIRVDDTGMVCLNDIHAAAGFSTKKRPGDWRDNPSTAPLLFAVLERITGKSGNWNPTEMRLAIVARKGANSGTYADVRLALAYAEYLNPKLAVEVKEVFLRYKAGDATLADEVLERASPEDNEWAGTRALSRSVRSQYTQTLKDHGATGKDYPVCTNAIYRGLFDKTAAQLKATKGVGKKAVLRDKMTSRELVFVMASEALSSERIEEERCQDGRECLDATTKSAGFIRQAIDGDRKSRRGQQQGLI